MYITKTTNEVKNLIEELKNKNDITKLKFLIYIFGLLNNNQINDKNEANPNLVEDDNIKIFSLELIGLQDNLCISLLQYFTKLYNNLTNRNEAYIESGNVLVMIYDVLDRKLTSQFEKLEFNEKLDVFSEIIIRYDNETYFEKKITMITSFDSNINGFDCAHLIQMQKV